jgi:acyl-CoA synthetase (AMP-forming)/AMP-acid ligase II
VAFVVAPTGADVTAATRRALPGAHGALQAAQALPFGGCLPKNNYGKVLKTELRAAAGRDATGEEQASGCLVGASLVRLQARSAQ